MTDGLALSALDWWAEAGVDTLVEETPRDWLARSADAPVKLGTAPTAPAAPIEALPPGDLAAFRRWLLTDAGVPGRAAARLDAAGDPASGTMVVVDMPEPADRQSGALLSGDAGALFDRMLGAIGLGRDAIYLAPFAPARPLGRLEAADRAILTRLMRHHIALARPRRLLLLGDAPAQALVGLSAAQARGTTHDVDAGAGAVPTIVSFHPRMVQDLREHRARAWADLQAFQALA